MIYTQFGSPVKIVDGDLEYSRCTVEYEDGQHRRMAIGGLKADNGLKEIVEAIKLVNFIHHVKKLSGKKASK